MPHIRTLTTAGVIVGATVLGGAGLAAADMHDADEPQSTDLEEVVEVDENGDPIDLGAPLGSDDGEETESDDPAAEETVETDDDAALEESATVEEEGGDDDAEATAADNHGQYVSGVARSTDPGPEHGATVSAAAQEQRDATGAERSEDAEETDDAEVSDDEDDDDEQGPAPEATTGQGR